MVERPAGHLRTSQSPSMTSTLWSASYSLGAAVSDAATGERRRMTAP